MSTSHRPLLLKGPRVCDPSQDLDARMDVLVEDGTISELGEDLAAPPGARVVDCSGLWLWPGLVDPHVHFRDPGFTEKEDLRTGGQAAAAGGYTAVVCEPNTRPPIDTPARARELLRRAASESAVRVFTKVAMTEGRGGQRMADLEAMNGLDGVVAASDDGAPLVDEGTMDRVCDRAAALDMLLSPH